MKVTREELAPAEEGLRLFTKEAIKERTGRSLRSIQADAADPACPLTWTHKVGKAVACDVPTLRAYLDWLRIR